MSQHFWTQKQVHTTLLFQPKYVSVVGVIVLSLFWLVGDGGSGVVGAVSTFVYLVMFLCCIDGEVPVV